MPLPPYPSREELLLAKRSKTTPVESSTKKSKRKRLADADTIMVSHRTPEGVRLAWDTNNLEEARFAEDIYMDVSTSPSEATELPEEPMRQEDVEHDYHVGGVPNYVTMEMLQLAVKPLMDGLEDSRGTEDILFEHLRNVIAWQGTMDEQWNMERFVQVVRDELGSYAREMWAEYQKEFRHEFVEWRNNLLCDRAHQAESEGQLVQRIDDFRAACSSLNQRITEVESQYQWALCEYRQLSGDVHKIRNDYCTPELSVANMRNFLREWEHHPLRLQPTELATRDAVAQLCAEVFEQERKRFMKYFEDI